MSLPRSGSRLWCHDAQTAKVYGVAESLQLVGEVTRAARAAHMRARRGLWCGLRSSRWLVRFRGTHRSRAVQYAGPCGNVTSSMSMMAAERRSLGASQLTGRSP